MSARSDVRVAKLDRRMTLVCAVLALLGGILGGVVVHWFEARDKHKDELMQHRREALFSALEVVDHVYANVSFNGKAPSNPHQWNISLARNAMNGIIIYCDNPNRTLAAFNKAIGLHNPAFEETPTFTAESIQDFRNIICEELELSPIRYSNSNATWIYSMPGAK